MSEPTHTGDPTAVILARVEVKLDNALTEQTRHANTLDRHEGRITKVENRTTALETASSTTRTGRTSLWAGLAATSSLIAVVLAVLLAVRGVH